MPALMQVLETVSWARPAFADREEAGRTLARVVVEEPEPDALVLALPRGGVPVALPVARALQCEMRPVAVRKLPLPDSPEMGFGAVTLDGTVTLNHAVMREHGVGIGRAALITDEVRREVERRAQMYPGSASVPDMEGRRVFVVDDGLATGYTMIATCEMVRHHEPKELVVCIPVAPADSVELVAKHCDRLVCLVAQQTGGFAVASFYRSFPDLSDDEVLAYLARSTQGARS